MRFCQNWQIYADDITVRSGRWIDGTYYTDGEKAERLKAVKKQEQVSQVDLEGAFRSLGFNPTPLGADKEGKATKPKKRTRTKGELNDDGLGKEAAADHSPRAHRYVSFVVLFVSLIVPLLATHVIFEQKPKSRKVRFQGQTCKTRVFIGLIWILLLSLRDLPAQAARVVVDAEKFAIAEVEALQVLDPSRVSERAQSRTIPAGERSLSKAYLMPLAPGQQNTSMNTRAGARARSASVADRNSWQPHGRRGRHQSRGNCSRRYFIGRQ